MCSGSDGHTKKLNKPIKDSVKVVFSAHGSVVQGMKFAQCLLGIAKGIAWNPKQILYETQVSAPSPQNQL